MKLKYINISLYSLLLQNFRNKFSETNKSTKVNHHIICTQILKGDNWYSTSKCASNKLFWYILSIDATVDYASLWPILRLKLFLNFFTVGKSAQPTQGSPKGVLWWSCYCQRNFTENQCLSYDFCIEFRFLRKGKIDWIIKHSN